MLFSFEWFDFKWYFIQVEDDTNRPLWLSKGWSLNRGDRLIEVKITVIVLDLWQPIAWHGCRLIQVRLFKFYLIRGWNQVKKLFWLLDCIKQYSEITETYFGVKWTKCHLPLSNKVTHPLFTEATIPTSTKDDEISLKILEHYSCIS